MRLGRCITDPAKHVQYRRESRASCQSDDDCGLAVCHAYPVYDSAALVIDHRKETVVSSAPIRSTGTGYLFIGPAVPTRTKTLRDGIALDAYHKTGVIVSENPQSPWHHATIFLQGTAVSDRQGQTIRDVALCESTDADGDLTWSTPAPARGRISTMLAVHGLDMMPAEMLREFRAIAQRECLMLQVLPPWGSREIGRSSYDTASDQRLFCGR